jgi:Zn-finger nucleic acid-binding protein
MLTPQCREGVEIDWCAQCRGVWLDRGELDKLINRLSAYRGRGGKPVEPALHGGQFGSRTMRRRRSFPAELSGFD